MPFGRAGLRLFVSKQQYLDAQLRSFDAICCSRMMHIAISGVGQASICPIGGHAFLMPATQKSVRDFQWALLQPTLKMRESKE